MTRLSTKQNETLFKNEHSINWMGSVVTMSQFHDYIPFIFNGRKYIMELLYPSNNAGDNSYSDNHLNFGTEQSITFGKSYRVIKVFTVCDNNELKVMPLIDIGTISAFSKALYNLVLTYVNDNRNIKHFFYETSPELARLVKDKVSSFTQDTSYFMKFHDDISIPFYGFSLISKL
ncbi:UNVERIFIED_ORG: hypothetical protein J2Y78_004925 [Buttiauxella agrestis ATCC 33320]